VVYTVLVGIDAVNIMAAYQPVVQACVLAELLTELLKSDWSF
jgi:hypothetical protein